MATTFASILDRPSNEIERPKPIPVGTYSGVVMGLPRYDKSSKKGTEFVEFTIGNLAAGDDVDADALDSMGGAANKTMKATYYLTEDAAWRLKDFLDHLGIEDEGTLRERVEQTSGKSVRFFVKHEPSQDGQSVFARIDKTMPAEE